MNNNNKGGELQKQSKQDTHPVAWLINKYPKLRERYGLPLDIVKEGNNIKIKGISDDFFAACLSELGTPEAPVVFTQGAFYRYSAETGIFESISTNKVETMLGEIMRDCANACDNGGMNDVSPLTFKFAKKSVLSSIRDRVAAIAEQPDDYFEETPEFIIFKTVSSNLKPRNSWISVRSTGVEIEYHSHLTLKRNAIFSSISY